MEYVEQFANTAISKAAEAVRAAAEALASKIAAAASASAAKASETAAAGSAEASAASAASIKGAEANTKFYADSAKDIIDQSSKGYGGGYSRTFTLTAPQAAWTALETPIGIYRYYADVALADCTAKWDAFAAVMPESYMVGYRARVANVIDTQDGSVRLYAVNAPDGDIKFTLSVFAVGSRTYYLTVPASGWVQNPSATGNDLWQCDVELEDSSVQKVPMGAAALENTTEALSGPGLNATMDTFDGYVRVYAKNKPAVDINIIVILLARNEVN